MCNPIPPSSPTPPRILSVLADPHPAINVNIPRRSWTPPTADLQTAPVHACAGRRVKKATRVSLGMRSIFALVFVL
jgi:hypothetical protein